MKKFLALLSLTAFLAVSVNAQSQQSAQADKKENAKTEAKASCCVKPNKACCKSGSKEAKACTPEQKAECAKMGASASSDSKGHSHSGGGCSHGTAKEASTEKTEATQSK